MSSILQMEAYKIIYLHCTVIKHQPSPPEYLIGFARITQVVLGGPGEQLLHISYATTVVFFCVLTWIQLALKEPSQQLVWKMGCFVPVR